MATQTTAQNARVVTGKVRLSYASIWQPKAALGSEVEKYSVSLIIPKSDKETVKAIQAAIELAKEQGKTKLAGANGKLPANLKSVFRDGDEERPDDEAYANSYFLNCSSKNKPQIVKKINGAIHAITDETEVYSGCYARVSLKFYAYNSNGSKGTAAELEAIMFVADGEPLGGGRVNVESVFGGDEDDDIL